MDAVDEILRFARKSDDDFYVILGCDETSSTEQILAEYKAKALDLHPDKNLNDESSSVKFQILLKAKEVLSDPQQRKNYDKWRNSGITMSFEQWCNLSKNAHTSMHWAVKKQKEPMLLGRDGTSEQSGSDCANVEPGKMSPQMGSSPSSRDGAPWSRGCQSSSDILNKFRTYQI